MVSETLLGDKDSWKEVWATNPHVESKDYIPAGIDLKYWTDTNNSTETLMAAAPPIPEPDPSFATWQTRQGQ